MSENTFQFEENRAKAKPMLPKKNLIGEICERTGYTEQTVRDIVDTHHDVIYDAVVAGWSVSLPYLGKLFLGDPYIKTIGDLQTREKRRVLTYPTPKFRFYQRFLMTFKNEHYKKLKQQFAEAEEARVQKNIDNEFDKIFKTKKT